MQPTIEQKEADPMGYLIGEFAEKIESQLVGRALPGDRPELVSLDGIDDYDAVPVKIFRPAWVATLTSIYRRNLTAAAIYEMSYRAPTTARRGD